MIAVLFHVSIFVISTRAQISTLYLGHLKEKGTTRDNYDSNPDIIFPGIGTNHQRGCGGFERDDWSTDSCLWESVWHLQLPVQVPEEMSEEEGQEEEEVP